MQWEADAKILLKDPVARGEKEDIFIENEATYFKAVLAPERNTFSPLLLFDEDTQKAGRDPSYY